MLVVDRRALAGTNVVSWGPSRLAEGPRVAAPRCVAHIGFLADSPTDIPWAISERREVVIGRPLVDPDRSPQVHVAPDGHDLDGRMIEVELDQDRAGPAPSGTAVAIPDANRGRAKFFFVGSEIPLGSSSAWPLHH
jgi:hypothetical protein